MSSFPVWVRTGSIGSGWEIEIPVIGKVVFNLKHECPSCDLTDEEHKEIEAYNKGVTYAVNKLALALEAEQPANPYVAKAAEKFMERKHALGAEKNEV